MYSAPCEQYELQRSRGDAGDDGEKSGVPSMMSIRVKHCAAMREIHMVAFCGGDVCIFWQAGLVDAFSCLDDLVQFRGDFRRRHASTEDITRRDRRAIEVAVGVFALDKHGALERQAGEKACSTCELDDRFISCYDAPLDLEYENIGAG